MDSDTAAAASEAPRQGGQHSRGPACCVKDSYPLACADPSDSASSPPPPPPPGFEDVAPGTHGAPGGDDDNVAELAKAVEQATVTGMSLPSSLAHLRAPTLADSVRTPTQLKAKT